MSEERFNECQNATKAYLSSNKVVSNFISLTQIRENLYSIKTIRLFLSILRWIFFDGARFEKHIFNAWIDAVLYQTKINIPRGLSLEIAAISYKVAYDKRGLSKFLRKVNLQPEEKEALLCSHTSDEYFSREFTDGYDPVSEEAYFSSHPIVTFCLVLLRETSVNQARFQRMARSIKDKSERDITTKHKFEALIEDIHSESESIRADCFTEIPPAYQRKKLDGLSENICVDESNRAFVIDEIQLHTKILHLEDRDKTTSIGLYPGFHFVKSLHWELEEKSLE